MWEGVAMAPHTMIKGGDHVEAEVLMQRQASAPPMDVVERVWYRVVAGAGVEAARRRVA
jgi:hypothetical protein